MTCSIQHHLQEKTPSNSKPIHDTGRYVPIFQFTANFTMPTTIIDLYNLPCNLYERN